MPQPRLLAILTQPEDLLQLELPPSWALKPVGAAYSKGLILIREGMDVLTGFPWNAWHAIGIMRGLQQQQQERMAAADAAHSVVQYNCESFIVEELVQDAHGAAKPVDYRIYTIGDTLLWIAGPRFLVSC